MTPPKDVVAERARSDRRPRGRSPGDLVSAGRAAELLPWLAALLLACATDGCDAPGAAQPSPSGEPRERGLGAAKPPARPAGATSPDDALLAAQRALAERDHAGLLGAIWPETREAWLADLVVELAVESRDRSGDPDVERRRDRAAVRAILVAHGATSTEDRGAFAAGEVAARLLSRVPDTLALHAELLAFADARRAPLDPVRALTGADEPSASARALLRLADRVRAPAALEAAASTLTSTGDAGALEIPSAGAFALFVVSEGKPMVLRLRAEDGRYWLDES